MVASSLNQFFKTNCDVPTLDFNPEPNYLKIERDPKKTLTEKQPYTVRGGWERV